MRSPCCWRGRLGARKPLFCNGNRPIRLMDGIARATHARTPLRGPEKRVGRSYTKSLRHAGFRGDLAGRLAVPKRLLHPRTLAEPILWRQASVSIKRGKTKVPGIAPVGTIPGTLLDRHSLTSA